MINVLMCGSVLSVKGGMVSVVKNYLNYKDWEDVDIRYIPTHINANKYVLVLYFMWAYIKILCLALIGKVDIVHLHTAERGSFFRKAFLVQTFNILGIKTVMHHHAAEFELFYTSLSERRKKYVRHILELTDLNIVLGEEFAQLLRNKASKAKVKVLYNAVGTYSYNPYNKDARNILFLGVLCERKGVYNLLQAIKLLDPQIDKTIKLYLCGDGEMEKVKQMIKELGISHRIAHLGWIVGEQKKLFMANAMVNVLPSYNEGLPMTILETMAYGIPNISTSIASIPEVLHNNDNGFLVKPGDIDALAEVLKKIIENSSLREEFSQKSYQLITKSFSLDKNIDILKSYYKSLI